MFYLSGLYKVCIFFLSGLTLILSGQFFLSWHDYYYFLGDLLGNNIGVVNIIYLLSLDSLSIIFLLLSAFLLMVSLLLHWYIVYKEFLFNMLIFLILVILVNMFLVNDLLIFFFFFESIVIPMFLLIGIWGGRQRRIRASYLLLLYTLVGSIFTFFAFLFLYQCMGSTNFVFLAGINKKNIDVNILFIFCFIGFAVKIPVVPLHLWLPEAHVEAPTGGSIILAGIVLKLSFYAFMRLLFLCSNGWHIVIVYSILIIGFIFPSLSAFVQVDMKKMVAYSSVAHMNFAMFGLFSKNFIGLVGCFYLMLGHALVASILFFFIGVLYDRYKTRILAYYGGLFLVMPVWSILFFLGILGNFALPGTMNFVGELLVLLGIFEDSNMVPFIISFGLIFTLGYSLFMYNRVALGPFTVQFSRYSSDITRREFWVLIVFVSMVYLWGLKPQIIMNYLFTLSYYLYCLT